jgi:hypothetical protein
MAVKRFCDRCQRQIYLPSGMRPLEMSLLWDITKHPEPLKVSRQRVELCEVCGDLLGAANRTFMGEHYVPKREEEKVKP